jgi:hypothetical protein
MSLLSCSIGAQTNPTRMTGQGRHKPDSAKGVAPRGRLDLLIWLAPAAAPPELVYVFTRGTEQQVSLKSCPDLNYRRCALQSLLWRHFAMCVPGLVLPVLEPRLDPSRSKAVNLGLRPSSALLELRLGIRSVSANGLAGSDCHSAAHHYERSQRLGARPQPRLSIE